MPPEPSPSDRKDLLREKRHERPETLAPSAIRWKDARRGAADEPRRTPGLGKQGIYQVFPEESGHGCTTSRFCEKTIEGDGGRSFVSRVEGKGGSSSSRVESKSVLGSYSDWKTNRHHLHPWDGGGNDVVWGWNSSSSRQQHDGVTIGQRSVDDLLLTHASSANSNVENSLWDESQSKDQNDKLLGVDGLGTGHAHDKDHSLDSVSWKALKWNRSATLSCRTAGFGYSAGSKRVKADSDDARLEFLAGKETLIQSPSGDAAEGVISMEPAEAACLRKKQRLGWGQGLAKYEKMKVEGPEDTAGRDRLIQCASNTKNDHNTGALSLLDKSPKVSSGLECMSPATPCSVACSSSSGERLNIKVTNSENEASNFSGSPCQELQRCPEEIFANMEHLELNPISSLSSMLGNLPPSQDASSGDSGFMQSIPLKKLLLLKSDILKLLENTECEIDLLENELKSLDCNSETCSPCPTASELIQTVSILKPSKEQPGAAPYLAVREELPCNDPSEVNAEVKGEAIGSPGTVTSKCSEITSIESGGSVSEGMKSDDHSAGFELSKSLSLGGQHSVPLVSMEKTENLYDEDGTCLNVSGATACVSSPVSHNNVADCSLKTQIFASNKELAKKASEAFGKDFPSTLPQFDTSKSDNRVPSRKSDFNIKEKLIMRKEFQAFKERVLTLKFRALHHLWMEDLHLLSLRKNRAKSQKRIELSSRYSHSVYQKHRPSSRSRITSPGKLTLVPATETFTSSKLPSDSQNKRYRDSLKMPALILDDPRHSRFISDNGLVEDPWAVEKEQAMINPWTPDEKEVFMEKLATFGKDFTKIASFLRHKTTADCVKFYYKNHKSESFEKVKRSLELRKRLRCCPTNTYMVSSGKKWNRDVNAASLDMLGAASAVASHAGDSDTRHLCSGVSILGCNTSMENNRALVRTISTEVPENESEAAAADVLASICGGVSSEAMSSCITSSVDPGEGCQEWKGQKAKSMAMEKPFTPDVSQNIDEDTSSDDSCGELSSADWTDEEKSSFLIALRNYGKDFASISKFVRTRSRDQCKIFFSKARKCLGLDVIHQEPETEGTRMSNASGGRSDTEDACVVEMDSAICSMQSCSKIDVDLPSSMINRCEESGNAENNLLQIERDGLSNKEEMDRSNPEVDTGMSELEPVVVQSGIKRGRPLDSGIGKFTEDEGQSGKVQEIMQMDAVLNSNVSVPLLDEADSFVDLDREAHGTDRSKSQVHLELGPTSYVMVETEQEEQSRCKLIIRIEAGQEIKPGSSGELVERLVPEIASVTSMDDVRFPKRGADANRCSNSVHDLTRLNANSNSSIQEVDACPGVTSAPDHQHQTSLELLPSEQKSQVISWRQQENSLSGLAKSTDFDHDHHQKTQISSIFKEEGNRHHQTSESSDIFQQFLPLQDFGGYPKALLSKELYEHAREKPVPKPLKTNRDFQSSQSSALGNFDGSKSPVPVSEHPFLPKCCEHVDDLPKSGSWGLEKQAIGSSFETEDKSLKAGDVKLFGKILSHPSSMQEVDSHHQENNDKAVPPKSSEPFSFKLGHGQNGTLNGSKLETASSYLGRQEFPMTSFGFWDGKNRMNSGPPLLPDSALFPAINNYLVRACQMEPPPPLSAVLRRNDQVLDHVLGYPTNDVSGNGRLVHRPLHQSYEGANVKPFSMELKRQDYIGFETLIGFQQGSAVVGMSNVGGGIAVGGCPSVSDPVEALKRHFANEVRSMGRSACVISEDESGGGDVAR